MLLVVFVPVFVVATEKRMEIPFILCCAFVGDNKKMCRKQQFAVFVFLLVGRLCWPQKN